MRRTVLHLTVVIGIGLGVAACSDDPPTETADGASATDDPVATETATDATAETAETETGDETVETSAPDESTADLPAATFTASAGTEQITVTDAEPGRELSVFEGGEAIATASADDNGAIVFRALPGGAELTVGDDTEQPVAITTLDRDEHPDPAFFADQELATDDLAYITTRDGTTLSANVWLPGPVDDGPYPTVVEYSGYTPSNPESGGFPDIFTALGYAYVGVNIRGTGCSGGSFRYFEYAQSLDGYDAIETVAAQPWVLDHQVGMVGLSYPGISQLFVAQTQPPSLIAITPLSVLADSYQSTLYPGGVLNTGFAVPWTTERMEESAAFGQDWSVDRVEAGDAVCDANQLLRLQNPDLVAEIEANDYWTDEVGSEIAPRTFVDRITVPTFLAGAWQDEQTGGHFATMLDRFTGTEHFYATLVNGLHTESIAPSVFPRFVEFLDLYVAKRTPSLGVARFVAPQLGLSIFGTDQVALPADDRFAGMTYDDALAAFEAEPPIQVLFEEGAAEGYPARSPMARFSQSFSAWPVPEAVASAWYLDPDGTLDGEPPTAPGEVGYLALPDAAPATFFDDTAGSIWSVDVTYDWQEGGAGSFAAFVTEPLAADTVVVGSGSIDLWMRSNLGDTDVEVTISEVRPDGQEMYVQSGWLRASQRALDDSSTELRPVATHVESDAEPLPTESTFELVRVELFPVAHPFRAGSRIRLTVDAPGGNRPVWEFDTIAGGEQVVIATGADHASRIVLPVVPAVDVPDGYPECGALRGQPCRPYGGG